MMRTIYKEGDLVGECVFINDEPSVVYGKGGIRRIAKFKCRCGNYFITSLNRVKYGDTKSCGCYQSECISKRRFKHGATINRTAEYGVWTKIRQRCLNKTDKQYVDYGGRGIGLSQEWMEYANFIRDMGSRPSDSHSIERINNDLGYCKENCKWATIKEQSVNRRNNLRISYLGDTKALIEWVEQFNMPYKLVYKRVTRFNWSIEEALTTPIKREKRYLHKT